MISPLEIRQHQFKKGFNGYNKDDVQSFLNTLAVEWERMQDDLKRTKQDLDKTTTALDGLRQVESALHRTLLQAEETSKATVEGAKKDAENKISTAEAHANEIVTKALGERNRIEQQIKDLIARRSEILGQLRNYLTAQTERLTTFEEKEMKRYTPPTRPADPVPVTASKPGKEAAAKPEAKQPEPKTAAPKAPESKAVEAKPAEQKAPESKAPATKEAEAKKEAAKPEVKSPESKQTVPPPAAEKQEAAPVEAKEEMKRKDAPKRIEVKPAAKEAAAPKPEAKAESKAVEAPAKKEAPAAESKKEPAAKEAAPKEEASAPKEERKTPIISVRPVPKPKEDLKPVGNEEKKSFFDRNVGNASGDDSMIDDLLDEL